MRIVILTQYYPPETGAPQNRLHSLASNLILLGEDVEVITAMPNYPKYEIFDGYKGKWFMKDKFEEVAITRSYIYTTKQYGILPRLFNYFSFTISSFFAAVFKVKKGDILICESPPLFLGITAVLIKWIWGCKLVFNVSDLWPESAEKLGIIKNSFLLNISYKLANWIYKRSDFISGQTQGIVTAIEQFQPNKKVYWLPNGFDYKKFGKFLTYDTHQTTDFIVLYAGIIGHAQGLETIIYAADKLKDEVEIKFYIIGDGPEKQNLMLLAQSMQLNNVVFLPNQTPAEVALWLQKCKAYVVPLRKLDLFQGAIPSKLFEPLAFGKPILLGVDGEARDLFIDKGKAGLYFEPENFEELAKAVQKLKYDENLLNELGSFGKQYVMAYFRRDKIAENYWIELKKIML
ncbi:MAG: glycosyltransferase family 4 protein [Chitinophagaceae bacterium]|nr:glycosyltransferase family 4 protein [Chitinophagaceae bacterium]